MNSSTAVSPIKRLRRFDTALALSVVLACVAGATIGTLRAQTEYTAVASYELTRGVQSPMLRNQLATQKAGVLARLGLISPRVEISASPGNPSVTVRARAESAEGAVNIVNNVAAELVATDRGVNRARTMERILRLKRRIRRIGRYNPRRIGLVAVLSTLQHQQVTDASFHSTRTAKRTAGPQVIDKVLLAFPFGVLVCAAALLAGRRYRSPA